MIIQKLKIKSDGLVNHNCMAMTLVVLSLTSITTVMAVSGNTTVTGSYRGVTVSDPDGMARITASFVDAIFRCPTVTTYSFDPIDEDQEIIVVDCGGDITSWSLTIRDVSQILTLMVMVTMMQMIIALQLQTQDKKTLMVME
jgi:hypothetical protein